MPTEADVRASIERWIAPFFAKLGKADELAKHARAVSFHVAKAPPDRFDHACQDIAKMDLSRVPSPWLYLSALAKYAENDAARQEVSTRSADGVWMWRPSAWPREGKPFPIYREVLADTIRPDGADKSRQAEEWRSSFARAHNSGWEELTLGQWQEKLKEFHRLRIAHALAGMVPAVIPEKVLEPEPEPEYNP